MITIAIETSARTASVAARADGRTLVLELSGRAHASDLLPRIAEALETLGAGPDAIGCLVVGTGPGSYTGLRVGCATALGLARGSGAALVGVPSVAALAYEHLREGERGAVVLDARAGAFYYALYERATEALKTLEPPCALTAAELALRLPRDVRILGDPAVARRVVPELDEDRLLAAGAPRADTLLELGLRRVAQHGPDGQDGVKPLYLRPFGASRGASNAR